MEFGLGSCRLTDGEEMRRLVVAGPDAAWAARLTKLLGHKSPVYFGHIAAALERPLDDLQTLFYVGKVGETPMTVAMVTGAHGAGILGHVYTVPEWRRRGASTGLFGAMEADVRARGYRLLTLGTNPDGHARRIYERMGFRQILPGSGDMQWSVGPPTAPEGAVSMGPVRWDDWGWMSAAAAAPTVEGEDLPRSRSMGVGGAAHLESGFLAALEQARPLTVLRRAGAAVGWLGLSRTDAAVLGAVVALDFYLRPECVGSVAPLLGAVEWPDRPVVCALGGGSGYKAAALRQVGFVPSAPIDALDGRVLWARRAPVPSGGAREA